MKRRLHDDPGLMKVGRQSVFFKRSTWKEPTASTVERENRTGYAVLPRVARCRVRHGEPWPRRIQLGASDDRTV